jgi:membrane protease subunit (stomatin/prohibitin family)
VYFVSTRVLTELRWGTKNPVVFRDKELGIVRLRGYGVYTLRIAKPMLFVNTLMGSRGSFAAADISDYFGDVIVSRLNDLLGETFTSLLDLPAGYEELADKMKAAVSQDFSKYGVELVDFLVNSVTPPDEVQKIMDERSGLGAVGDVDQFLKFEAARALGGNGQGGTVAGPAAAGASVGAALGAMLPVVLQSNRQGTAAQVFSAACGGCGSALPSGAGFCPQCGVAASKPAACPKCGAARTPGGKFCASCGEKFA